MARELFYVCREETRFAPRWVVRRGDEPYGEYLSESAAILDAVEAAQDAGSCGDEAHVVVEEPSGGARLEWSSVASPVAIAPAFAVSLGQETAASA
jgi:hypothetical protein